MIDSEIIPVIFSESINNGNSIEDSIQKVFQECEGLYRLQFFRLD